MKLFTKNLVNIIFLILFTIIALFPKMANSDNGEMYFNKNINKIEIENNINGWLENESKKYLDNKTKGLVRTKQGQCVVAVRNFLSLNREQISGIAKNFKIDSKTPSIGAIVKTSESIYEHVAVVIDETDTQILIFESNYKFNEYASVRWLDKNSNKIVGYKKFTIKIIIYD